MTLGRDGKLSRCHSLWDRIFDRCADDPKTSVHRCWGISLIFVILYCIFSVVEVVNIKQSEGGSTAHLLIAIWMGILHLMIGVIGTYILKRFATSFAIGFLLGILLIVANQNLILFESFHDYEYGKLSTHRIFGSIGFCLFLLFTCFAIMLFHFSNYVVIAPIDAKGPLGRRGGSASDYQAHR